MKTIIFILLMTLTASAEYTDLERRDMKYLKLEGLAAKEQHINYKATYNKLTIKLNALIKVQLIDNKNLLSYRVSHRCTGFTCSHSRTQRCYSVRTKINKLRSKIRKNEPILAKYKREVAENKKFAFRKLEIYNTCVKKYKVLLAKG